MNTKETATKVLLAAAVLSGASACSDDPVQPSLEAGLTTAAAVYTLAGPAEERVLRVGFTFYNDDAEAIYFPNCVGEIRVVLEAEFIGRWVSVADAGAPDCLGPPVVAPAGEAVEGSLTVAVRPPGSFFPSDFAEGFEPPGTYRLRILAAVFDYDPDIPGFGTPVDPSILVSNTFEVRP